MLPLTIPELRSPFPIRINPHVNQSFAQTQQWVKKFRLHEGPAFESYKAEGLTWMTARFYPNASPERLFIVDRFNTLLFAMDDLMDHNDKKSSVIRSRDTFEDFISQCLKIMEGKQLLIPNSGHLAALSDVWTDVCTYSTAEWQHRFTSGIRQMFDAALWSHDNVAVGRLPSITEFYRMRPFLGAANTSTDMIEFAEGIVLPSEILNHPKMQELTRLCQITVCLANDLFSLSKEMAHQDKHNMVTIAQHEKKLTLKQAIRDTVRRHNRDVASFTKLLGQLPHTTNFTIPIYQYVTCLSALMRGNIDWSIAETNRYNFTYKLKSDKNRRSLAGRKNL